MNKIAIALSFVAFVSNSFAQSAPTAHEITSEIIRTATAYANAISCGGGPALNDIAALTPYKTMDDRMDEKYAVLWMGDIGCSGGTHSMTTNIAIVQVGGLTNPYYVDPLQSSPVVKFGFNGLFERIVGNTKDTLILEGMELGQEDPACCPSVKARTTLRVDQKGNWKIVAKKIIAKKK